MELSETRGPQAAVILPAVFDPTLIAEINCASKRVTGQEKYPALHHDGADTGERFGLEYQEPDCCPVPLDWDKHRSKKSEEQLALLPLSLVQTPTPSRVEAPDVMPSTSHPLSAGEPSAPGRQEMQSETKQEPLATAETSDATPLPLRSSPRSARIGPIKTGGRVFVLDQTRWTTPMKEAFDGLLQKFHGEKDMLKLVDQQYADVVQQAATDPNSLLHPTTRLHISRYVKHRAKLLNASSSLNTSPEKLLETQQLWHSLTEGSKTATVPVVTIEPVTFDPQQLLPLQL